MILAADNLSAARPRVARAIRERDGAYLTGLARRCREAGAAWLDLNPGYLPPRERAEVWRFLVATAEAAPGLTLLLDAPRPEELALALDFCNRPPVLNMATAEPARLGPVLDLAAAHGVPVVAACMTATVPATAAERLSLAALLVDQADRRGIPRADVYLDPMVMPLALSGGEGHARAVVDTLRALPQLFDPPPASLTSLSNLVTRTAGARAEFAAPPFLAALWGAGLTVALLDALDQPLMATARLCRVFAGEQVFAPGEFAPEGPGA
ncbi:MAG: dihydropteroate synthase [Deltaproteobacteria bacterium]|nr:dihydropteroate synthase [Deltaproteobacteria bacterium]